MTIFFILWAVVWMKASEAFHVSTHNNHIGHKAALPKHVQNDALCRNKKWREYSDGLNRNRVGPQFAIWYNDDNARRIQSTKRLSSEKLSSIPDSISITKSFGNSRTQHRDVVIVGGALAGLSAAIYLSQIDPSRHITIIDRDDYTKQVSSKTAVASMAAAGMLAPSSERLPKGYLLDLCHASRRMYRDFCEMVETMAKDSGDEGAPYLAEAASDNNENLQPWNVGYVASGGFLAPAFAGDAVATWAPPENDDGTPSSAVWLDSIQVRELEPNVNSDVVGGWWFPEDANVDARRLTGSLRAACAGAGNIQLLGNCEVTSLDLSDGICHGLWLKNGKYVKANTILVANGAWMRNLLPVPISPHKGQSLSLKMPPNQPPLLRRVLFAQDCYIVPKADGNIIVGATVEAGSYDANVTPAGLMHILHHALQLVPGKIHDISFRSLSPILFSSIFFCLQGLASLTVTETWAGLRPTTPDKGPLLGKTKWKNLYLAGGYWRNGVLLAPKTGYLVAMMMSGKEDQLSEKDRELLDAFSWDRFTSPDKATELAANSRYAASMYPVHTRTSSGVSATVGTELGSYSTARSAGADRAKDRNALWSKNDEDDAFEKAAMQGMKDGSAYQFGDKVKKTVPITEEQFPTYYEGSADALTVGSSEDDHNDALTSTLIQNEEKGQENVMNDINAVYAKIIANKAKTSVVLDTSHVEDERPDPGFRIYYDDEETGERIEVPPYSTPGEFFLSIKERKEQEQQNDYVSSRNDLSLETTSNTVVNDDKYQKNGTNEHNISKIQPTTNNYDETTFDGYQVIQKANSRLSRAEELETMREARKKNRLGQEKIDKSKIGVHDFSTDDD